MIEEPNDGPGRDESPRSEDPKVLDMIIRAYDTARNAYSESVVASDFRLDLSPSRQRELEREREAAQSRVFAD